MVSISKYQGTTRYQYLTFKVSKYRLVHFKFYSWIPRLIHRLNFLYSDFNYYFFNIIIVSFNSYKLDLQRKYRVSSIEHNSGILRYRRNCGIHPALGDSTTIMLLGQFCITMSIRYSNICTVKKITTIMPFGQFCITMSIRYSNICKVTKITSKSENPSIFFLAEILAESIAESGAVPRHFPSHLQLAPW